MKIAHTQYKTNQKNKLNEKTKLNKHKTAHNQQHNKN